MLDAVMFGGQQVTQNDGPASLGHRAADDQRGFDQGGTKATARAIKQIELDAQARWSSAARWAYRRDCNG